MKFETKIYNELLKKAKEVGFEVKHKFANYKIFALELGCYLEHDRCEIQKNEFYYREMFEQDLYPNWYNKEKR